MKPSRMLVSGLFALALPGFVACTSAEERRQRAVNAFQGARETASGVLLDFQEKVAEMKDLGQDSVKLMEEQMQAAQERVAKVQEGVERIREGQEFIKEGIIGD